MFRFVSDLRALSTDETAPTAVEYAVLAASVAVAIVATVSTVGRDVVHLFKRVVEAWPK